jgi:hypothetical protein
MPNFRSVIFPIMTHNMNYHLSMYLNHYILHIPIIQGLVLHETDIVSTKIKDNTMTIVLKRHPDDSRDNKSYIDLE